MYYPRALPSRMTVAGLEIEYLVTGSGPALLYLHSMEGADPDSVMIARLAKHFTVHVPALPGFGLSERDKYQRTVDDLSYFCLDYMEAQGLTDVTLVGSSFGGWVALELATKGSGRISRLVLDNPVGLRFQERAERDLTDIFRVQPFEWTKLFLAGAPEDDRVWSDLPEDVALRAARNREAFTRLAWSPFLHNPRLRGRLHRVTMPTLVLWGDQDRVASRAYATRYAAALPHARLDVIVGAGHFAFHDQPQAVADAILSFVGEAAKA